MASNVDVALNGASDCGVSSDDIEQTENTAEEGHELDITESVNEFSTKTWKEDLVLSVEGRKLYVSSHIMALTSPVFSSMLEEAFKKEGHRELELSDRYDDFVEFLRCFYPGIMKPITMENAPLVAPLAHQYQVKGMTKLCEQFLIDALMNTNSTDIVCSIIQLASSCQMVDLRRKCIEVFTRLDDIQLEAAVSQLEIAPDFKHELQNRKEAHLKENLAIKSDRCAKLENSISRILSTNLDIGNPGTVELAYIDVSVPNYCRTVKDSTIIRTICWTVCAEFEKKWVKSHNYTTVYENLYVNITASSNMSSGQWQCKTHASCSVSYGKHRLWKQLSDANMLSRQLLFDFGILQDFELSNTQDLKISVFILVGDVLI